MKVALHATSCSRMKVAGEEDGWGEALLGMRKQVAFRCGEGKKEGGKNIRQFTKGSEKDAKVNSPDRSSAGERSSECGDLGSAASVTSPAAPAYNDGMKPSWRRLTRC